MTSRATADAERSNDIVHPSALPFILVHVGALAAVWTGVSWSALALCVGLYWLRMFAVTAGYHRYFSHRAYATSRVFQFLLAVLAQSTGQKSVLWWAAKHRHHHLYSDTANDLHSPAQGGFFHAHVGWIFDRQNNALDFDRVEDLARYPELRWLHRFEMAPPALLAALCFLVAGWSGLVVGFLWSTVLVYHVTFCINSLAHVHGSKRYVTGDDSRNNLVLAVLTMGEGWHNNHHAYQSSARQGFRWWEVDATYYVLKLLSALRVVWDLKTPPELVLKNQQRLGDRVIHRTAQQLAARFNPERIAHEIHSAPETHELVTLRDALGDAQARMAEMLASLHLPHIPSRSEFVIEAKALFARTISFDDIVDRARALLLAAVGEHLSKRTAQAA